MEDSFLALLHPSFSESLALRAVSSVLWGWGTPWCVPTCNSHLCTDHNHSYTHTLTFVHNLLSWSLKFVSLGLKDTQKWCDNLRVQTSGAFSWELVLGTP